MIPHFSFGKYSWQKYLFSSPFKKFFFHRLLFWNPPENVSYTSLTLLWKIPFILSIYSTATNICNYYSLLLNQDKKQKQKKNISVILFIILFQILFTIHMYIFMCQVTAIYEFTTVPLN